MKKSFFAAFLCLALVFSGCASKASEELSDQIVDIAVDEAQNTTEEISEELASEDGELTSEDGELTSEDGELTSEESEENQIEAEEETEELLDETSEEELLEEIEEPIVRDAPVEEEPEVSEEIENLQEEDSSTIESVEIEELEIIPEPQENDEEPVIEENILSTDDVMDVEDEISAVIEETEEPEEENTSENSEETEETEETETEETETVEKEIIPSRSVKIRIGEYLDVEYPGRGWIYIGITDLSKNVTYFGRKLGTENTKYTFLGKKSGTVILHFYKEDVLTDTYIDDYLEVEIEAEKTTSKNHVTAPAYSEVVPKPVSKATKENTLPNQNFDQKDTKTEAAEVKSQSSAKETKIEAQNSKKAETEAPVESKTESTVQTVVKKAPVESKTESTAQTVVKKAAVPQKNETAALEEKLVPDLSPEELLSAAKNDYENKNLESALENVKAFLLTSPSNADEGLFLLGQIYESNGQVRDIKKAVEAYEKITSSYPASQLWDDAKKRAVYLKRFYINIR